MKNWSFLQRKFIYMNIIIIFELHISFYNKQILIIINIFYFLFSIIFLSTYPFKIVIFAVFNIINKFLLHGEGWIWRKSIKKLRIFKFSNMFKHSTKLKQSAPVATGIACGFSQRYTHVHIWNFHFSRLLLLALFVIKNI